MGSNRSRWTDFAKGTEMNPYYINEPAAISFSGGRTSAYMLYKILEAHDGKLPNDVQVTFANTGKEMPETLDFVQACSDNWGVDIVWLEFQGGKKADQPKIVNYKTASRNGEPFDQLTTEKSFLPNAMIRGSLSSIASPTIAMPAGKGNLLRRYCAHPALSLTL